MIKLKIKNSFNDKNKYKIFLANKKNSLEIRKLINLYWKKNHIFFKSKKLFEFQHLGRKKLNWILARNKKTNKIEGILGLVSKKFFSMRQIGNNDHLWIAIIMVAYKLKPSKGLGTEMIKYFNKLLKPKSISAIGINFKVSKLYKKLGLKINFLKHYYILNKRIFSKVKNLTKIKLMNYNDLKSFRYFDQENKDSNYFLNRYLNHPIYKYLLIGFYFDNKIINFLVMRKIKYKNKNIMSVIDIGSIKKFKNLKKINLITVIKKFKLNYIDFINFGINEKLFKKIGMKKRTNRVIIPHHFEPFENKNVDVMFSYISKDKYFYIFKGDSDLDRPSLI